MKVLCFDIGGTNIKYALIENDNLENLKVNSIITRKDEKNNYILEDILSIIEENKDIDAVGISSAGVVDSKEGKIIFAGPTIPNYTGTEFKKVIEEKYKIPCYVENDVNSAAYGEYIYGNYDDSMFCLTIGTGVGGSFILDDKVFTGSSMTAGEIGYMPYKNGYFQDYSSATFLTNYVSNKLNKNVDGKYIFDKAKSGDVICNKAIDELIDNLCHGLLNIVYILNPKHIVIGGGITAQGDYLEKRIINKFNEKLINENFKSNIKLAKLKNSAGIYGIYYIVKKGNGLNV